MDKLGEDHDARIFARKSLQKENIFTRLPTAYAAARAQGQKLLKMGGGLSIVEWRTLWDLHEIGPMTIRDLAEMQNTNHSLLSRALPAMRRKGYVSMTPNPSDGRQTIVALAPAGLAAHDRAAPIMARRRAALHDIFTPDESATFIALFDRLDAFLSTPLDDIVSDKDPQE